MKKETLYKYVRQYLADKGTVAETGEPIHALIKTVERDTRYAAIDVLNEAMRKLHNLEI